jgi:hypothetical protein
MTEPKLTPQDARIVAALLAHGRQEDAAAAARVSLRTLQRRAADPAVREELRRLAGEQLQGVTVMVARHGERAVEVLAQMADGTLAPQGARVKAAVALAGLALRVVEVAAAERLAAALEVHS